MDRLGGDDSGDRRHTERRWLVVTTTSTSGTGESTIIQGSSRECRGDHGGSGPPNIVEHLRALGIKGKASEADSDGRIEIHSSSMLPQGRWMVAVGVVLCAVSLVLDSQGALRYEADHIPSRPEVEGQRAFLRMGVGSIKKLRSTCVVMRPILPMRPSASEHVFRSGDQSYKFPLHAGEAVRAGDHRIQFERETHPDPRDYRPSRQSNRAHPHRALIGGG